MEVGNGNGDTKFLFPIDLWICEDLLQSASAGWRLGGLSLCVVVNGKIPKLLT